MLVIKFGKRITNGEATELFQEKFSREFRTLRDLGAQLLEAKAIRYTETRSMDWDFGSSDTYQLELTDVLYRFQVAEEDAEKVKNFLDLLQELDYEFEYHLQQEAFCMPLWFTIFIKILYNINVTTYYKKGKMQMENSIAVQGQMEFMGLEIPVVYGGFGRN